MSYRLSKANGSFSGFSLRTIASFRILPAVAVLLMLPCSQRGWGQTELVEQTLKKSFNAGQPVETVALSPDDRWGAVGSRNGAVGVFALEGSGQLRWVSRHKGRVNAFAFNRVGTLLAASGDDGVIDLISLDSAQVRQLPGTKHKIWALAFSPGGDLLASAGDDSSIIVWDVGSGAEEYQLPRDGKKSILYVGFNGMATRLLAVDMSGQFAEWDVKTRARLRDLKDSDPTINNAAGSFSGDYVAVNTELTALPGRAGASNYTSPNGLFRESRIKLYDTSKFEVEKTLDTVSGTISSISLSADNHYVAVARFLHEPTQQSYLSVYDIGRGLEVISLPSNGNVMDVAFSADGRGLLSGADNGDVRLYAIKGIMPSGEVGDLNGMKFKVTSSQPTSLIPADTKLVIGVMDFDANGVDPGIARAVAELSHTRIASSSSVTLVERAKMDLILHEQNFQYSNRADPATATKLGQLLGASKMIFGSVSRLGTSTTIHTEMVDVQSGKVDGSAEVICQKCSDEDLPDAVATLKHYLVADSH